MKRTKHPNPNLLIAMTPAVLTLLILETQIFYFGVFEPHIPLAIGLAITSAVVIKLGLKWKEIEKGIFHVIHVALPSVSV
jgi:NhaC family Na+:H+ antiporter